MTMQQIFTFMTRPPANKTLTFKSFLNADIKDSQSDI